MRWLSTSKTKTRQPQLMMGQSSYVFRRSRTLTGTPSMRVAPPPAAANAHLKSPRQKLHELYEMRARIFKLFCIMLLGVVVCSFLVLNYIGTFVVRYSAQGSVSPSSADLRGYRQSITQYFGMHPFERFGFLLNAGQLQSYMLVQHSELSAFTASRAWYGGGVEFTASFRKPILVWQTGNQRFYVDSNGEAFTRNYFTTKLVSVVDQSGITPTSGASVASHHFIYFLGNMVGALNRGSAGQVSDVIIPASTREIDVKLQGRGYLIKTDIERDPLQEAEDILNALRYFDAHKIVPQYIDARVGGKVFYK